MNIDQPQSDNEKNLLKEKKIKNWLFSGQSIKLESTPFLMYMLSKKLSHECRLASKLVVEMKKKNSYYSYARPAQPGPNRTRLCGPCTAAIAGDQVRFGPIRYLNLLRYFSVNVLPSWLRNAENGNQTTAW